MKYKLFAQQTILVFLANLIIGLSGIILLPILTRHLPISDYGLWVQFVVTLTLILIVTVLGLPSYSMVRFLSGEKNKKRIQEGFYSIAFTILLTSLIASLILFIFSDYISQIIFAGNSSIVKLLALTLIFASLNIAFQYFFITFQEIKKYSSLLCFKAITLIIFISGFILFNKGITGAVTGFLCNEILFFLINFSIIFLEIGFRFPKFTELKSYLTLSIPTIPGSLSYWIVDSGDRYLIGALLGITSVGYYSPGYTLGAIVGMFAFPITSILTSYVSKSYNERKEEEVKDLLEYSFKYFLIIAIPATIGLSVLSKPLLTILTTTEIANNGYMITPFIAIALLLLGLNDIIVNIIILEKKTKIIGITWFIAAFLNLVLNLIFIPIYGILGAALSTLITYIIPFTIISYFSLRYIKLDINLLSYLKIFIASIPIILSYQIWKPISIIDVILFISINIIIYLIFLVLVKVLNKDELIFIRNMV